MGRRGLLSSLGTGLALVVAGVLACAAVIGAVAFKGFPELSPDPDPKQVVMPSVAAERATDRRPIVLGARPRRAGEPAPGVATTAVARSRTRRRAIAERRQARVRAQTVADGRRRGNAPSARADDPDAAPTVTVPSVSGSRPGRTPADAPAPSRAPAVAPVVREVQDVVTDVTDAVPEVPVQAPVPAPSVPIEVPAAVKPVADAVGDVVGDAVPAVRVP